MESKILTLAKKLKALSDRGIGGEKENAAAMLMALCKRHNIDPSLLEENVKRDHQIYLPDTDFDKRFFVQIASSVLGGSFQFFSYKYKMKRCAGKKRFGITCTDSEFIEIMGKYKFFYDHYQNEVDVFYKAFIQTNKLFQKRDGAESDGEERELTPEEKAEIWKISNMMNGMERKVFLKQIER